MKITTVALFARRTALAGVSAAGHHRGMSKILPALVLFVSGGLTAAMADSAAGGASAPAAAPAAAGVVPVMIDPVKENEIRRMIDLSGVKRTMGVATSRMLQSVELRYPSVPKEVWARMASEMNTDDLINRLVPVYDHFYTLEDLRAINAFYSSPSGQHLVSVQPELTAAAMQTGEQWGREVAARVMSEIQAEQAKTATPPAAPGPGDSGPRSSVRGCL